MKILVLLSTLFLVSGCGDDDGQPVDTTTVHGGPYATSSPDPSESPEPTPAFCLNPKGKIIPCPSPKKKNKDS